MSTNIKGLIHRLIEKNIRLVLEGEQLRIKAAEGALSPDIIQELRDNKAGIITFLKGLENTQPAGETIRPIPEQPHYELSHAQKRLWILDQFEEAQIAYNMGNAYVFNGPFDYTVLETVVRKWVERHEVFRTTFREVDGEPRQHIAAQYQQPLPLEVIDVTVEEPFVAVREAINAELLTHFSLSDGHLFKLRVYRISADKCVFFILMHHIISDGWSLEVLLREFVDYYNVLTAGQSLEVAPLSIQYKDYANWHNTQLSDSRISSLKDYWTAQYHDGVPVIDLPRDFHRPNIKTYNGRHIVRKLNREASNAIKKQAEQNSLTLFMSLISSVSTLLYRYTGQDDMVIGTTIAGRPVHELDNQVGFFVNTLPLRIRLDGNQTYANFSREVHRLCLEAFEHQAYPFDMLVDDLHLDRDISRSPMFDVMVQLLNTNSIQKKAETLRNLDVTLFPFDNPTSQFDLCFNFMEEGEDISLDLEYNTDLFSEDRMNRLIGLYESLAITLANAGEEALGRLDYLPADEKDKLLSFSMIEGGVDASASIVDLIQRQVQANPDHPAVVQDGQILTYRELDYLSDRIAAFISARRYTPATLIGLLHDKSVEAVAAIVGVWKAGHAYVPLDPALPDERIRFMLNDCQVPMLISHTKYEDRNVAIQWESSCLLTLLNTDREGQTEGGYQTEIRDQAEMWDYLGENFDEEIELGGWISSYTGEPFTAEEMNEYSENALIKLKPHLTKDKRVLEIGCSSGLTLFKVAPYVGHYHGTDLSANILAKTERVARQKGLDHVVFTPVAAHQVCTIEDRFDIIIINSVIQSFAGHVYLLEVIEKSLRLLNPGGLIFFGDIQDLDLKQDLIRSLRDFNGQNANPEYLVKSDWSKELFLSRSFFEELVKVFPGIEEVSISAKTGNLANELRDFRFDCIAKISNEPLESQEADYKQFSRRQYNLPDLQDNTFDTPVFSPGQMAYTIYTSGTTGQPKGVSVSHDSLQHMAMAWRDQYHLDTFPVRLAQIAAMSFDVFVGDLCRSLANGGTMNMLEKEMVLDIESFYQHLQQHRINILESTIGLILPLMKYIDRENLDYDFLELLIIGSDVCLVNDFEWLTTRFGDQIRIINSYGTTETTIDASFYDPALSPAKVEGYVPIGKPMKGVSYFVLDGYKNLVPMGVEGELHIGGPGVANGYLNRPDLTAERFLQWQSEGASHRVYNTGDLVRWLPDGNVQYIGRADQQVKIRGYRVETEEVENILVQHELADNVVVTVETDEDGQNFLVAYVERKNDRLQASILKDYARQRMPEYLMPRYIVMVEKLAYTKNGKLDRKALPDFRLREGDDMAVVAPSTHFETVLVAIWSELLGLEGISIRDNFFEIGGHSLKAIQMVSRIQKELDVKIDIKDVFICQTIEELATRIEARDWVAAPVESDVTDNEKFVL